jgi:hypothetical protein
MFLKVSFLYIFENKTFKENSRRMAVFIKVCSERPGSFARESNVMAD